MIFPCIRCCFFTRLHAFYIYHNKTLTRRHLHLTGNWLARLVPQKRLTPILLHSNFVSFVQTYQSDQNCYYIYTATSIVFSYNHNDSNKMFHTDMMQNIIGHILYLKHINDFVIMYMTTVSPMLTYWRYCYIFTEAQMSMLYMHFLFPIISSKDLIRLYDSYVNHYHLVVHPPLPSAILSAQWCASVMDPLALSCT